MKGKGRKGFVAARVHREKDKRRRVIEEMVFGLGVWLDKKNGGL